MKRIEFSSESIALISKLFIGICFGESESYKLSEFEEAILLEEETSRCRA